MGVTPRKRAGHGGESSCYGRRPYGHVLCKRVRDNDFSTMISIVLRQYPSMVYPTAHMDLDGQCHVECRVQYEDLCCNAPPKVKLLGWGPSAVSLSSFQCGSSSQVIEHLLWQPEDPLCGSVRSAWSPNGNLLVGVVSRDAQTSCVMLYTRAAVEQNASMGFGAAQEVCVDDNALLFLAGNGVGGYCIEREQTTWRANTALLPSARCLCLDNTSRNIVTGHRRGGLAVWDTRTTTRCSYTVACDGKWAVAQVQFGLFAHDLWVSHVDGQINRYDLRYNVDKGPYQRISIPSRTFSGTRVLGQFMLNTDRGFLATVHDDQRLYIYDIMSLTISSTSFPLPVDTTPMVKQWSRPFSIPSVGAPSLVSSRYGANKNKQDVQHQDHSLRARLASFIQSTPSTPDDVMLMSISDSHAILIRPGGGDERQEAYNWTYNHW